MKKCLVNDCTNHAHEGVFIGELCSPCHQMMTTGTPRRVINAHKPMLSALKWAATVIRSGSDLHNDMTAAIAIAEKGA